MRILVIEDDISARTFIADSLRQQGHGVDEAGDGDAGLELGLDGSYDVIVTDRMLPGCGGIGIVQGLREADIRTPVLMLTALGSVEEKVEGLNAGADDYLAKPFVFSELSARIQALVRRPPLAPSPKRHVIADLEIDLAARSVVRSGQRIDLTAQEFRLLEILARNTGHVVTRAMLLESLWGLSFEPRANLIDAHVSRLRAKVDRGFDRELIRTVRGVGYVLSAES